MTILKEAHRLWKLGFAIHWLQPNSKRPVESGWTTGPRKSWEYLSETYFEGLNVGVRLGSASKIKDHFLAVVDVDVKSTEKRHRLEAINAARELLGLHAEKCPVVLSGRGNGSRHYYCLTRSPFKTWNPQASTEMVKVYMPSKKPSRKEIDSLSEKEIKEGIRVASAWEISLYSEGRQVVLPPSIHPDSGKPYVWGKVRLNSTSDLPIVEFVRPVAEAESKAPSPDKERQAPSLQEDDSDFEVVDVDLGWLSISERIREGILTGDGVTDRSGFLLPAATALFSAGLSKNEILSVLTDPKTFLGACAYDHAKTKSRRRAAHWVWKYTLKKVMSERSAELAFANAESVAPERKLSEAEVVAQNKDFEDERDWRQDLERSQQGQYKATLSNCKTILMNVCGVANVIGRNEFAANDFYLVDTPWRSRKGQAVSDIDITRIKTFCVARFNIEFGDSTINHALLDIADVNRFHPVRDWLNTLRWDGVNRIDTWLKDYAGADAPEPYLSDVSRKLLCAMVKRVFEPGCKFDHVVILEGNQGTGKSTMLARLAGQWFSDAPLNIGDKDAVLTMQSKWLIELGELSSMGKADLEILKAFISQGTDRIRAPYGKRVEEFPRQCVFVGSTNIDEYLRDLTGNRRFWSVKLKAPKIDFDGISRVREQLFAEAVAFYKIGEPLYLEDTKAEAQAVGEQAKRLQSDEWISTVEEIIKAENFPREFEMTEVAKRMDQFGAHKLSPSDVHRITRCLKLLGYERFQEGAGFRRRLWRVATEKTPVEKTPDVHGSKSRFGSVANRREKQLKNGTNSGTTDEQQSAVPKFTNDLGDFL